MWGTTENSTEQYSVSVEIKHPPLKSALWVVQRLGRAGMRRFRPRVGHRNSPFRGWGYMIPYMFGKLAPNSTHSTRGVVYVPNRGYFRAIPSQNGDTFVPSPPPSIVERVLYHTSRGCWRMGWPWRRCPENDGSSQLQTALATKRSAEFLVPRAWRSMTLLDMFHPIAPLASSRPLRYGLFKTAAAEKQR